MDSVTQKCVVTNRMKEKTKRKEILTKQHECAFLVDQELVQNVWTRCTASENLLTLRLLHHIQTSKKGYRTCCQPYFPNFCMMKRPINNMSMQCSFVTIEKNFLESNASNCIKSNWMDFLEQVEVKLNSSWAMEVFL